MKKKMEFQEKDLDVDLINKINNFIHYLLK